MKWLKIENDRLVEPPIFDKKTGKINCHLDVDWLSSNGFRQWADEEINQWADENYPTIDQDETEFNTACSYFRQVCAKIGEMIGDFDFKGDLDDMPIFYNNPLYKTNKGMQLAIAWSGCYNLCKHEAIKLGIGSPEWWYKCWNISMDLNSDLVELGILSKPISEYTVADIGSIISIPYTDKSGKILLNNGCIEFEVVGVNHHTNSEHKQTITLMTKDVIRKMPFDAKEPNNPHDQRAMYGNNRWKVSNIRQWLNSGETTNSWFTPQHEYDEAPSADKFADKFAAYANEPGFLAGFSADVLQHFTDITNTTGLCEVDGDRGIDSSETTVDKVFLASITEMKGGGTKGGKHLSVRYPDTDSRRKSIADHGCYWLRSPLYFIDSCSQVSYISNARSCGQRGCLLFICRYRSTYSASLKIKTIKRFFYIKQTLLK